MVTNTLSISAADRADMRSHDVRTGVASDACIRQPINEEPVRAEMEGLRHG